MADLINKIRTRLLLDHPFFGSLAMRLDLIKDESTSTLSTNGTILKYSEEFLKTLTNAEQVGCMAHEVMHCALQHMYRRNSRTNEDWNSACDYAINPILKEAGITLPANAKQAPQYAGMSAEQIYSKMQSQKVQDGQNNSSGGTAQGRQSQNTPSGQPQGQESQGGGSTQCPTGDFTDGVTGESQATASGMTEQDWQIATEQAAKVAQAAGKLPAGMNAVLKSSREPAVDWVSELREFVSYVVPSDYSWTSPNRRYLAQGIFLPGIEKSGTGELVIGVDTSGSCYHCVGQFTNEIAGILAECRPEKITVIYCDAAIGRVDEYGPDDFDIDFKPVGGGGTRFAPVFQHVEREGIEPVAMVYLTDLYACDKPEVPSYPVLWVAPEWSKQLAPFGRRITIGEK